MSAGFGVRKIGYTLKLWDTKFARRNTDLHSTVTHPYLVGDLVTVTLAISMHHPV